MAKSPDAFRTISEVADWLHTPAHVLRFWESRFPQISPVKGAGGRRYFRPDDMQLLGGIKRLLHDEGHTIKAVQTRLQAEGIASVAALSQPLSGPSPAHVAVRPTTASQPETPDAENAEDVRSVIALVVPTDPDDDDIGKGPPLPVSAELRAIDPADWPRNRDVSPIYDRARTLRDRLI